MMCNICNDNIFQDVQLKYIWSKDFIHYASLREKTLWKMNKSSKENLTCTNCEFKKSTDILII